MAKPISTKKVIMLLCSIAATVVIFFAMSLSASAASYPAVKLDVPRISQRPGTGDCAIASMATVEAYCHGLPSGDYNSKAYQSVYAANGYSISASWSKIGYKAIDGFNMTTLYDQLKSGYPVIVRRSSPHYSVVYGYDGSTSKLELSGFLILDVDDSYNNKSPYMRLDDWVRGSLDRIVVRQNGLAISSNTVKITNNHPAKTMEKGEDFTAYGVVVSDTNLTNVTVSVSTSSGTPKQTYTANPSAKSFNLSKANDKIDVSALSKGSYVYTINAKDSSGDTDSVRFNFTIGGASTTSNNAQLQIKEVSYTAVVEADPSLNMRKGAGTEYAVLCTISKGEKISVTGECDGWARATYGTKVGWVSMQYIKKCTDTSSGGSEPVNPTVNETKVNYYARVKSATSMKESISLLSSTITNLPKNTIVKVIGESDGWLKLNYKGKVGWVRKSYCVVKLGDIDGNGKVNSTDALVILKASAGSTELSSSKKTVADFNGDGKVNSVDGLMVLRLSSGAVNY